ncbi:MAG TPA: family 16 glycoside hydrolase [Bacteroidales bacterium]|nr:family 16 glycoside hydrolase [Bacteroidales bacterium]
MNPVTVSILLFMLNMGVQNDRILFDGKTLEGWEIIDYDGHGDVYIADSSIIISKGEVISGIRWKADFPKTNYEITLYARRVEGNDFFCGMTFPVKDSFLTLVLGGWGGSLSGLSCIDGADAAHNFTQTNFYFGKGWWWAVRLRVTDKKIEAWVEDEKFVDFTIGDSQLSLRSEVESSVPFGITTYQTTGAIRDIKLHMLEE